MREDSFGYQDLKNISMGNSVATKVAIKEEPSEDCSGKVAAVSKGANEDEENKSEDTKELLAKPKGTLTMRSGYALSSQIISAAMKKNKIMRDRANLNNSKMSNNLVGVMAVKMEFEKDE